MDSMIYSPLDDFESKYKALHAEETNRYFDSLAKRSGVNIEENRRTVKEHRLQSEALEKLRKRLRLWKFLRVLMCITLLLIPLVIFKITPKIKYCAVICLSVNNSAHSVTCPRNDQQSFLSLCSLIVFIGHPNGNKFVITAVYEQYGNLIF